MLRKYYSVFGPALRILDALILSGCWLLAYFLRDRFPLPMMHTALPPFELYWAYAIVVMLLWGTIFSISDLYTSKRMTRRTVEAYKVLRAHTLSLLIFMELTFLITAYKLSRGVFVYFYFLSGFFLIYGRIVLRNTLRNLRSKGFNIQQVLIVGSGSLAQHTLDKLSLHPELGLKVIGFVASKENKLLKTGIPVLGGFEDLTAILKTYAVDKVVIALSRNEIQSLETILNSIKDELVQTIMVPDIYDYLALGCEVEDFDGLPMVSLNETPMMGFNLLIKRVLDIGMAVLSITITMPLMIFLSLFIKLTSRGPIFYTQERMSMNGKVFHMLKFRSMIIEQPGDVELMTKENDPRVTWIGRLMRKASLDELPQFINVLKGDMSIVGPRPERTWVVEEVRTKVPRYMLKHKVKAGITGWAQVNGWRGNTSLEKRIEYDLYYIKNWSILFDLKILFLTVFRGLINKNAY